MDKLEAKLLEVYKENGLDLFLDVAQEILKIQDRNNTDKKMKVNGGVCEIVLRVMTEDYLRKKRITGFTARSLVLKDPTVDTNFRTELDFCLFTKKLALCGECKSFYGAKVVTDKCTLSVGERLTADIYRQQTVHVKTLQKHLRMFVKHDDKMPMRAFCFVFANGTITDKRSNIYKEILPVLTVDTLYPYYDEMFARYVSESYHYTKMKRFFDVISGSDKLHEQHREYLGY